MRRAGSFNDIPRVRLIVDQRMGASQFNQTIVDVGCTRWFCCVHLIQRLDNEIAESHKRPLPRMPGQIMLSDRG